MIKNTCSLPLVAALATAIPLGLACSTGDERDDIIPADGQSGQVDVDAASSGEADSDDDDDDDDGTKGDKSDHLPDDGDDGGNDDDGTQLKFDLGTLPSGELPDDRCAIDFLFVIDNSGSMSDEQTNLANSVPDFVQTMTNEIENLGVLHVGVVTTEAYFLNSLECVGLGGLITQTFGDGAANRQCGPYASGRNYMTGADDLDRTFGCAAKPGISGSGDERPMDALRAALSPNQQQAGSCNAGFLRRNAVLVVTVITDEEDDNGGADPSGGAGSTGTPAQWHAAVLAAKDDRPEYAVALALIGIDEPNECAVTKQAGTGGVDDMGAEISRRIAAFTGLFGERGSVGDVCAKNYDPFFQKAVEVIELACDGLPEG